MGIRVKAKFWEKDVTERYSTFQTNLKNWEQINLAVVEGIHQKYYAHA